MQFGAPLEGGDSFLGGIRLNQLKMSAYDRFKAAISDEANLAVNLAELRQSIGMMENRLLQLWRFTRAVRRGDVGGMKRALGVTSIPRVTRRGRQITEEEYGWRTRTRQASSTFLEWHFGWSPLIGDVYNTIDLLQSPIKATTVQGSAKDSGVYSRGNPPPAFAVVEVGTCVLRVKYRAEIAVDNPNLYLANSLGLINPAVVLWEIVPFSFVLDWFVNVGDVLSSMTDFLGLTVQKASTTTFQRTVWSGSKHWVPEFASTYSQVRLSREVGISTPNLGRKPFKLGLWRGLTAASLLGQQLKEIRKPRL